jgi:hypothetical protein
MTNDEIRKECHEVWKYFVRLRLEALEQGNSELLAFLDSYMATLTRMKNELLGRRSFMKQYGFFKGWSVNGKG